MADTTLRITRATSSSRSVKPAARILAMAPPLQFREGEHHQALLLHVGRPLDLDHDLVQRHAHLLAYARRIVDEAIVGITGAEIAAAAEVAGLEVRLGHAHGVPDEVLL